MAATLVKLHVLLTCLHLGLAVTPYRVADNAIGYSRIVVATPGMRRYTYDIAHDREGRDFSIDFSPVDRDLDLNNFLQEPEGRFLPQYQVIPVSENEEVQLHVKHPTHEEMEKSSRAIQTVHAAYSKKPPQKAMLEDFDLGVMGYADFMDSHDEPRGNLPQIPYPQNTPTPQPFQPLGRFPNFGYRQAHIPQPKVSHTKNLYKKLTPQKAYVEKVENPQVYEAPLKLQKPLFVPAFDEGRLNGLADKAYSKVFMAHGFSKPVPRYYPKQGLDREGVDMAKTLFVPVVIVPSTQQSLVGKQNIDRSASVGFESRKIVKKRV